MRGRLDGEGISGAFEELPALLVVLVAISLFTVSMAHSYSAYGSNSDRLKLQEDCQDFARMVRNADMLCPDSRSGEFDMIALQNLSTETFLEEFNPELLGFQYRVTVQDLDMETGNVSMSITIQSAEMENALDIATFSTCVNLVDFDRVGAGRLTVSIWRTD